MVDDEEVYLVLQFQVGTLWSVAVLVVRLLSSWR